MKEILALLICFVAISALAKPNEESSVLARRLARDVGPRRKRYSVGGGKPGWGNKGVVGGGIHPEVLSPIGVGHPGVVPGVGAVHGAGIGGIAGVGGIHGAGVGGIHGTGLGGGIHGAGLGGGIHGTGVGGIHGAGLGGGIHGTGLGGGILGAGVGGIHGAGVGGVHGGGLGVGGIPGVGVPGAIVPVAKPASSSTCRRWCKTPEGQAYCCEGNHEIENTPVAKPGFCPPVRPKCPPVRSFAPPKTCSHDGKCFGVDKCCFDRCLEEHVCKPPQGSGGYGR